ncbi:MAG: amidohydrolase, partial [Calditrichaeota bacterium]|nr:amidohydrolase [Calditrichota bacterium]
PLQNLKILYGTGTYRLNDETGKIERVGGIDYTIKAGIVFNAKQLLKEVRDMVNLAKQKAGIPLSPMPMAISNN